MVLRWVFRSEIDAAREGISAIGGRLREGQALVVEASSTTAAAFRFTLGAATALAAGFFLSLGLDAIVLIGKWEILLAMVFYTSVLWALVSPILLIPRTMAGLAEALERAKGLAAEARAQTQSDEKLAEIDKRQADLEAAIKAHADKTSILPNWARTQAAIDEEKKAADQEAAARASLVTPGVAKSSEEPSITPSPSPGGRVLRVASLLLYFGVLCSAGWLMLGPIAGFVLTLVSAMIFFLARKFGIEAVLPLATVILIFLGYSLGERFQDLPLSATIETDRELLLARIVASTSTELIVLTPGSNSKRRSVAMVPRSVVRKVTIDPQDGPSSLLQLLSKLLRH
jgi:hypothetical protein